MTSGAQLAHRLALDFIGHVQRQMHGLWIFGRRDLGRQVAVCMVHEGQHSPIRQSVEGMAHEHVLAILQMAGLDLTPEGRQRQAQQVLIELSGFFRVLTGVVEMMKTRWNDAAVALALGSADSTHSSVSLQNRAWVRDMRLGCRLCSSFSSFAPMSIAVSATLSSHPAALRRPSNS